MPPTRWGFGDVAIALGGAILVGNLLAAVLLSEAGHTSGAVRAWTAVVVLTGPWLLLGGWPLYATRVKGNGPVRDLALHLSWRSAGIGVLGGALGLLTASIVAQLQVAITHQTLDARASDVAHDIVSASQGALVVFALATAFGAPVVEELAFRGLTYGALRKRGVPVAWSVVWTTLLFAAFHFEPQRLLVLAVLGGWIGAVRAVTGSTVASMVAHMTVNIPGALLIVLAH
jgi:membrane protease YdiL (CAAX protease family)